VEPQERVSLFTIIFGRIHMSSIAIGSQSVCVGMSARALEKARPCIRRRVGFRAVCVSLALLLATERAKADEPITVGALIGWGVALILGATAVKILTSDKTKVKVKAKADKVIDTEIEVETDKKQGSLPPQGNINKGVATVDTNFKIITGDTGSTVTMNAGGQGNAINAGLESVSYLSSVETTFTITPQSVYDDLGISLNVGSSVASITQTTPLTFGEAGYNFTAEIVSSSGTTLLPVFDKTFEVSGSNSQTVDSSGLNQSFFITSAELANLGIGPLDNVNVLVSYTAFGSAVPEPSTWALILIGFAGLGFAGYRSKRRKASYPK
jgi:PEP-CTERM motif